VVVGVIGVAALVGYLIVQAGGESGSSNQAAIDWEAGRTQGDGLPGEYVNLPELYKDGETLAQYGADEGPDTASHVTRDMNYEEEQGLPPAGGPHWGQGGCPEEPSEATPFCGPVPWGIYTEPWEPESVVHNMEHAGVVIWYDTTDQTLIEELIDMVGDNDDKLVVLTPLPGMEDETVAVTVWGRRYVVSAAEFDRDTFQDAIDELNCKFDPEDFC
jgi:hypothetical protein